MPPAASLAIACLFAAGLLDTVFKFYSIQPRSRGMLIYGVGCIWFVLQSITMMGSDTTLALTSTTLIFGSIAAVFVTGSNILLLESLGQLPISLASTIYRLNTIPLVILAFFFLGEDLGWMRIFGIAAGLTSVLLLYQPHSLSAPRTSRFTLFLVLIVVASCVRALYGIVTKAGINHGADVNTMMLLASMGWILGGLGYARFREHSVEVTRRMLSYILAAGVLVFGVVWLLTMALRGGDASLVVPITNMGFIAAFALSIVLKLEALSVKKVMAIVFAVIAIVLLSR